MCVFVCESVCVCDPGMSLCQIHELSQGLLHPLFNEYRALASTSAGPHLSSCGKRRETGRDSGKHTHNHTNPHSHTHTHRHTHTHTPTHPDSNRERHTDLDTSTERHLRSVTSSLRANDGTRQDLSFGHLVQYIVEGCKEHVMNELEL